MHSQNSHSQRRVLRKISRIGLVILFMLSATLAILGNPLHDMLLDTNTYIQLMDNLDYIDRSQGVVADLLVSTAIQTENEHFIYREVSIQTWESVAEVVLPNGWLESSYSSIMKVFFTWLDGNQVLFPPISIDLSPIKEILSGSDGVLAVLPLLQDVPDCVIENQMLEIIYFGPDSLINCWPKNESLIEPAGFIAQTIGEFIPDSLTPESLGAMGVIDQSMLDFLLKARTILRISEDGLQLLIWLSGLLLTLYGLMHSRSLPKLMRRLPLPLYLTLGLCLICIIGLHFFIEWGAGEFISSALSGSRSEIQILAMDFVQGFFTKLEIRWISLLGIIFGISLLIDVACRIVRSIQNQKETARPSPDSERIRIKQQFR